MLNKKKVAIIGSGFAGLSAAAVMASKDAEVHVFEKNEHIGGRARQFTADGFLFDMGPSWYWMPDVMDEFFHQFGHEASDFYQLKKLDPGFQIIFGENDAMSVPAGWDDLRQLFEDHEPGAAERLDAFMKEAEFKYQVGMKDLANKPGLSITELFRPDLLKDVMRLQVFSSFSSHVRKYFNHPKLIALMEFPVLFLGATAKDTPALYSLMNYSGLKQGTFYPMGGFGKVIEAMRQVAEEQGAVFHTAEPVTGIEVKGRQAVHIGANGHSMDVSGVIGAADYHHIEQHLLPSSHRNYDEDYWDKRAFAPSCLLFYLGVDKKVKNLIHHNLFFDEDIDAHADTIYRTNEWPTKPLFYVCCPSKTDPEAAPEGKENLFVLMPIAPGLKDSNELRASYYDLLMKRMERFTGDSIRDQVIYKRSYCVSDFIADYNAYKGNAYGLANTLRQTANLKPKLKSKKLDNLFFAGQLTVPGPGVPPSIISGQLAAKELSRVLQKHHL